MNFRHLTQNEKNILQKQRNQVQSWDDVRITDTTDCSLISECSFIGKIDIGPLSSGLIQKHGRDYRVGIRNSVLCDCIIGEGCVIENVGYGFRLYIEDRVILSRVDEIFFEKGFSPSQPAIRNENGGRAIPLHRNMTGVEAFLFSEYKDNSRWVESTLKIASEKRVKPDYCLIESGSSIQNCRRLVDIRLEQNSCCRGLLSGKNIYLSRNSFVDNVCALENGIAGVSAKVSDGVIARNFFLGEGVIVEGGAFICDSFIDANSHIAGGEIVSTLTGPFHVQHHKSSFLIASMINGESNLAAGAIVGSNHNSRHAEGELMAGRGFWPGLSVSLKHNSQFASFNLIEKGLYKNELNNPFPFALITRDEKEDCTVILPAYYLLYNLYALERGKKKFKERDKRAHSVFPVEFDYLSVDTIDEILSALPLLEGREDSFFLDGIEKGAQVKIIKSADSLRIYKEALLKYSVEILADNNQKILELGSAHSFSVSSLAVSSLCDSSLFNSSDFKGEWINICGVNFLKCDLDQLIKDESLLQNNDFFSFRTKLLYLLDGYDQQRRAYACKVLKIGLGISQWGDKFCSEILKAYVKLNEEWSDQIVKTRRKDFDNPFVRSCFRSEEEMYAVLDPESEYSGIN